MEVSEARLELIPTTPSSDWRDLPNKVVQLKDGSYTKKLVYEYDDVIKGRSSTGTERGVCACADGKSNCDPSDKQDRTLLTWCLPHTSNKNNQWADCHGRVDWDGFFSLLHHHQSGAKWEAGESPSPRPEQVSC